ncbi:MAG: hypothetical protein JWO46_3037, partial [Nocardioidaceae bacterium]|nr:hypothetical protein [Nocardioidaceae bacterium]
MHPGADDEVVAPTHTDPAARAWSERFGGPVGSHGRPHSWWTPVRVVLAVATIVCCLGIVQKVPCIQAGWADNDARYGKMCYSDIPYLYTARGFAEQTWPYSASRYDTMEYPVGISYFAYAASLLTVPFATGPPAAVRAATPTAGLFGLPGMQREVNRNFLVNAVLLMLVALAAAYFLVGAHRRRPWDALMFAASPLLLVDSLINWDLLAVACVCGAFWAWARGKPVLTGVLIGLGTATKLYPLFLLGAMFVVCLRRREIGVFATATAAAVVAWLVLDLPVMLTGFTEWKHFWTFNADRGPDLGSLWLFAAQVGHTATPHTINVASWLVFGIVCLLVLVLGMTAPKPPRMAQLAFLIVAAFLLVNKVYSPQYALWLLPLAVLARPRWRDQVIWQACELFYFG